jgi:hypothetical protein
VCGPLPIWLRGSRGDQSFFVTSFITGAAYSARVHTVSAVQAYYSVGWFTLSLINAGLAQGKGRSGLAWWLISLLIGPLATLLIVILPGLWGRR